MCVCEGELVKREIFLICHNSTHSHLLYNHTVNLHTHTHTHSQSFRVKVPYLLQDASMLLPPTDTPLTGIEFTRRLPCGETERARKVKREMGVPYQHLL